MNQLVRCADNVSRENVVINRATFCNGQTVIGNKNFLMEGVHVSHDTKISNGCVFGYGTKIAGDCEIHDNVICSSNVIVNPGSRIGDLVMVSSGCRVSKDVPPYILANGNPVLYSGLNVTILTSQGISDKTQNHMANAYRLVFHGQTSIIDAIAQVKEQVPDDPEIRNIVNFLSETKLGVIGKM